jgi:hypothetical protein
VIVSPTVKLPSGATIATVCLDADLTTAVVLDVPPVITSPSWNFPEIADTSMVDTDGMYAVPITVKLASVEFVAVIVAPDELNVVFAAALFALPCVTRAAAIAVVA